MELTAATFGAEMEEAVRMYDRHVVCLEKTPDEFREALLSLMGKAVQAYVTRAEGLRHGIALDRFVTIILSQTDGERPLCGIYFNLHSPYSTKRKRSARGQAPAA